MLPPRSVSPSLIFVVPTRPPDTLIHHAPCPKSFGFIFDCHSSGVTPPASRWQMPGPNFASQLGLSHASSRRTGSSFAPPPLACADGRRERQYSARDDHP